MNKKQFKKYYSIIRSDANKHNYVRLETEIFPEFNSLLYKEKTLIRNAINSFLYRESTYLWKTLKDRKAIINLRHTIEQRKLYA